MNDGFNIKDSDDDAFDGGWVPLQEEEETSSQAEGLYADMENIPINTNDDEEKVNNEGEDGKNGPPKVVLTNSFEMNHQLLSPKEVKDDKKLPRVESDITTEMEDLHCSGENNNDESGLLPTKVKGSGKSIQYDEQGDNDKYANNDNNKINQSNDNDNSNNDDDDNNYVPTFDESIQQFYRRMNEVLVETRKQQKYNTSRVDKKMSKEDRLAKNDKSVQSNNTPRELSSSTVFTGGESYYNIYLVLIFGVVAMCTIWFTLGCYGFYVLVLGGGRRQVYLPPSTAHGKNPELASNIIIQIVTPETMDGITTGSKNSWWSSTMSGSKNNNNKNGGVVSITLEDWKKVQQGVASAMAGEL
jgi:hypothetical protein